MNRGFFGATRVQDRRLILPKLLKNNTNLPKQKKLYWGYYPASGKGESLNNIGLDTERRAAKPDSLRTEVTNQNSTSDLCVPLFTTNMSALPISLRENNWKTTITVRKSYADVSVPVVFFNEHIPEPLQQISNQLGMTIEQILADDRFDFTRHQVPEEALLSSNETFFIIRWPAFREEDPRTPYQKAMGQGAQNEDGVPFVYYLLTPMQLNRYSDEQIASVFQHEKQENELLEFLDPEFRFDYPDVFERLIRVVFDI